jgi:hypothetical protein
MLATFEKQRKKTPGGCKVAHQENRNVERRFEDDQDGDQNDPA